jgi:hypothetical protein
MITRFLQKNIEEKLFIGKIILLVGARQVGKSTLLRAIAKKRKEETLWLNADEGDIRNALNTATTSSELFQLFGTAKLVIIDEAQQIDQIGLKLKLIIDNRPDLQIIATGSSAFELLQKSNEPLTGRKIEFKLYPISVAEMINHSSWLEENRLLETRLVYGNYPEIINNPGQEKTILNELVNSYLFKDLFRYGQIKKADTLERLLQALAFQIGNEVSYNELAQTVGNIDPATVEKYVDLLQKAFILFKLPALNRNLRNELKKGKKIFFYDNGVRNTIISNFNSPNLRNDKGALWENYMISERIKRNEYCNQIGNTYFWRTFDQTEIDYIEEYGGKMKAFEFKWQIKKQKMPNAFMENYTVEQAQFIDTNNYQEFIMPSKSLK